MISHQKENKRNMQNKTYHAFTIDPETGNTIEDSWLCDICNSLKKEKDVILKYAYNNEYGIVMVMGAICLKCNAKLPKKEIGTMSVESADDGLAFISYASATGSGS